MEIRQATAAEIPYLKTRLAQTDGEQVDLEEARVFVAIEEGAIIGMFPLRMVWQGEPLLIFPECANKITRSRATYLLFDRACAWLADKTQNRTGIRWFFGITRSPAVIGWADRIGLRRQYEGAATFTKFLGDHHSNERKPLVGDPGRS